MNDVDSVMDILYSTFADHIEKMSGGEVVDHESLKKLFLFELPNMIINYLDENVGSGMGIDELYGDDVFECIEFPQDGNEYDDEIDDEE